MFILWQHRYIIKEQHSGLRMFEGHKNMFEGYKFMPFEHRYIL